MCVHARHGDPAEALAAFADVITYWQQTGRDVHQLTTLRNLPALLARVDAAAECALILGAVGREDVQPTYGEEATRLEADRAWACGRLGEEAFVRHCRAGAELDIGQAAEAALTIIDRLQQTRTPRSPSDQESCAPRRVAACLGPCRRSRHTGSRATMGHAC